jgi:hypothetical protein
MPHLGREWNTPNAAHCENTQPHEARPLERLEVVNGLSALATSSSWAQRASLLIFAVSVAATRVLVG